MKARTDKVFFPNSNHSAYIYEESLNSFLQFISNDYLLNTPSFHKGKDVDSLIKEYTVEWEGVNIENVYFAYGEAINNLYWQSAECVYDGHWTVVHYYEDPMH
ncbi:MAG: hypothetical protein LBV12_12970 [Puniceicoccales bacterium]|jgi:hypothetical protein|nr:hypothetical protein [Puniceicoccales bacterium]